MHVTLMHVMLLMCTFHLEWPGGGGGGGVNKVKVKWTMGEASNFIVYNELTLFNHYNSYNHYCHMSRSVT